MNVTDIAAALRPKNRHACAVCLKYIDRGEMLGRDGGGTRMTAQCHGYSMTATIPDALVEDGARVWWFLDVEGVPYETKAARERRLLGEELEFVRAARARINEGETS